MRIGIMTPWWTHDNYGQILQGYALQTVLNTEGFDAFIIKYNAQSDIAIYKSREGGYLKYLAAYVKQFIKYVLYDCLSIYDKRKFNDFKKRYIKLSKIYLTYEKLLKSYPKADVYIAGSDQIWGPWFRLAPYFLDFGKKEIKRIAYASSFGREELSDKEKTIIAPLIKKLDFIGVRELSGIEVCKRLGDNRAMWVPDPTMLLTKEDWINIIKKRDNYKVNNSKIFIYVVGNDSTRDIEKVVDIINENSKYFVYYASDINEKIQNITPTIDEWVSLINDSDIIITNSFHGTVFSILLNKQFITMPRINEQTKKMNTRIISLLERLNIRNRFVDIVDKENIDSIINSCIDWEIINKEVSMWREQGKRQLFANI
ncbi:MAG: polysaccharide pyruvyl transferase family protein [Bacteroidetes bacterium]|nr:polysaccharide pyruvyl transferase family protein [Bacteroidota bacterium]